MAVASGLASSLGVSAESTYGTYVAPARWFETTKQELKKVKNTVQGKGMRSGRLVDAGARRVVTSEAATGKLELEVTTAKMGVLLAQVFGGTPAPVQQAATAAYLQTHVLTDNRGRSLTAQVGVPDLNGVVLPYTLLGGKVTTAEFSCGVDEQLTVSLDLDGRQLVESQALVAPSYVANLLPFHFMQATVKIGATVGAAVAVAGVKKVSLKLDRGQATDRFYFGASGLKAEPIINDLAKVSGSIETDLLDKTLLADRFANDGSFALVWEFVGAQIAPGFFTTLRFTMPLCYLDDGTPTVEGLGLTSPKFSYVALGDDAASPVTCEVICTDTAL